MNTEQDGLKLVQTALREGRISIDEACYFTAELVPEGRGRADIFTYRCPEIHEPRAQQEAARTALARHLDSQERVPRAGLALLLRRRKTGRSFRPHPGAAR